MLLCIIVFIIGVNVINVSTFLISFAFHQTNFPLPVELTFMIWINIPLNLRNYFHEAIH